MATTKNRQRKLERDRHERKLARRAQQQRRRRRGRAGLAAFLTLALLGLGTAWLMGAFEPEPEEPPVADRCFWQPMPGEFRAEVGTPAGPTPTEGEQTATIELDAGAAGSGQVTVALDVANEPCGSASLAHLAGVGFYDGTTCHQLTTEGALRCGDPSGTSEGGPTYAFYGENHPFGEFDPNATEAPSLSAEGEEDLRYPAGTVALADVTGAHGSQLFFFYQDYVTDTAAWPILGTVTEGLDLLAAIGAAGPDGELPGPPAEPVTIQNMTVTDPPAGSDES